MAIEASTTRAQASADFSSLYLEFQALGFMQKATGRIVLELAAAVATCLAGCALFWLVTSWPFEVIGILIATVGMIAVGTNAHTSSHWATHANRRVNEALSFFGFTFILGLSSTMWYQRHVRIHHPAPNVVHADCDGDLMPWFALTEEQLARASGWRRFYHLHLQFWLFPFVLAANAFNMQLSGWKFVFRNLRSPKTRSVSHWSDLACLIGHYLFWIVLPCTFLPIGAVLTCYGARVLLMSYAMFAVLGPGHYPAEATRLDGKLQGVDFALLQAASTVNFTGGLLASLTCSGLQYQIEHHLFPQVSHVHYPRMAPLVRAFCERHGIPYRSYPWHVALWKSWYVMKRVAPVTPDLESSRLVA